MSSNRRVIPIRLISSTLKSESLEIILICFRQSLDIEEGDLLVTSGLGGIYPEGFPVAHVSEVERDTAREFAVIEAEPVVDFERLRYLLLIWPNDSRQEKIQQVTPESLEEQ